MVRVCAGGGLPTLNWIFSYVKGYSNRGWLTMIFTVYSILPTNLFLFYIVNRCSFHLYSINPNSSFLFHYVLSVISTLYCIGKQCQLLVTWFPCPLLFLLYHSLLLLLLYVVRISAVVVLRIIIIIYYYYWREGGGVSTTTTTRPKSENENDRDAKVTRCIYLTDNLRPSKPHSKENIADNPEITFHNTDIQRPCQKQIPKILKLVLQSPSV